ncbi:DUF3368 domain-containing protein [Candidatus Bathyarchaeota archaeon]|nr:DUF3368 domain-containing protein [Candidatus Bathyarchaeota archaeon]
MRTVSDSTPLILYAKIGRLDLLEKFFNKITIPSAVYHEVVTRGKQHQIPDAYIVEKVVDDWINVTSVDPETQNRYGFIDNNPGLDTGEKEALKLCKQIGAQLLLADDRLARKTSKILNIKSLGSLGVVIQAIRHGVITKKDAYQIVDDLLDAGLRLDIILYKRIQEIIENTESPDQ